MLRDLSRPTLNLTDKSFTYKSFYGPSRQTYVFFLWMNASPLVLKVAVYVLRIAAAALIGVNPVIAYMSKNSATEQSKSYFYKTFSRARWLIFI